MSQDLYDLPVGWEWKRLIDVCDYITDGSHSSPTTQEDGFPYVTVKDVLHDGTIDLIGCKKISKVDFDLLVKGNCSPQIGSVLLSKDGTVGKVALVNKTYGNFVVLSSLAIIHPNFIVLTPEFLKYYLMSPLLQEEAIGKKSGAAIKRIVLKTIKAFNIPLPPLAEQTRIVEKLDAVLSCIDTAIDELQQSLALIDAMFDSYLSSLSYETVKLGDLVNITTGRLDANAATDDGEFSFFTCSRETYRIDNYAFDCEAILLAGNNAVGDFNVKHFKGKFNAYQRTYVITVKDNNTLLYRFLYFQLVDSMLRFKNKSIGSGTKFLKIGMIKDLDILLPNLVEQQQVIEELDALNDKTTQLKTELTAKIGMFNQLKASVLDGAFKRSKL